ncbi:Chromatin assembly factor 1 subunit rlf2 [Pseudocercospora fuligena]|uniref:Chromatin assembly factor 1 subunit rlf2 n=1 Tax=Pseudocercospora fuligena TaxID=685502 RepID=A0A8H6RR51_9PEZI|nr:Chromatin assembly factor 1 subunit rlf2 [Pseudocercospora fuligena]
MADVISPPAPITRKRPAPSDESPRRVPLNTKGTQFMMPTPPDTEESSNASPDGSVNNDSRKRAASPALSCSTIESSIEVASSNAVPKSSTATAAQSTAPASTSKSTSGPPPAKRRKLTPAEKLEQAQAKEAKAREAAEKKAMKEQQKAEADAEKARKAEEKARKDEEKAEEKARKDEEKARRDEEKTRRDEEKRAKAEEREAKKREKELEEERKVQEKLAKERKQMRLGAFFGGKPSTPAKSTSGGDEEQPRSRRKSLSLEPFDAVADQIRASASPSKGTPPPTSSKKPSIGDYKRTFLPFQLPPTGSLAPVPDHSEADQERFDHELNDPSIQEKYDLGLCQSYANLSNYYEEESKNSRGLPEPNIEKIVDALRGVKSEPIDLTGEVADQPGEGILQKIPVKHIHFHEDVRPDYYGTFTQIRSPRRKRKVSRNPFTRARPDTDYDVDSEAEWEEPEEGDEEIGDEEDDEVDSQADAGEMDDFLDDEDDVKIKRKAVTDSLAPESTGLCWENERGRIRHVDGIDVEVQPEAMSGMRIGFLLPGFVGATIDPFSTSYWEKPAPVPTLPTVPATTDTVSGLMAPPRQPLQPKLNFSGSQPQLDLIGAAEGQKGPITSLAASQAAKRGPKPAPKTLSKEDLEEFKEAVIGSPLGKLELQKGLKSRFPKLTNETIKENLNSLFAQKGAGKTKQWVYVGDS